MHNLGSENDNLILAGDFNTCYRKSDQASGKLDKSGDEFCKLMRNLNLLDIFVV